ncbi:putative glutathione S-transferase [Xylariaceae sp. FL0255]|nr:putative glutathione S-transferase [Xylariaceae sp. FL0255]
MAIPDADVYPAATGAAKPTVDAHSAEQPLKLYSGWFCPFVQRTWIVLEEKGIPYQYVEINPYHKGPELMRANPRGLVPTLEVAPGKSLYESSVLCQYLEDNYPSNKPALLPSDPYERARSRIWMDYVTSRIIPAFHRLLQFQPGTYEGNGEARLDELRAEFRKHLLEYFGGKDFGLVDVQMIPWAARLWIFDEFKGGLRIPEKGQGGDDEKTWERYRVWMTAVNERDSVKKTTSERVHYLPLYKRYADDIAQSELAKASRSGHGVP